VARYGAATNSATDALVGRGLLEAMVGMFLGSKTDPRDPLANPLENDFKGFPPLYINAGGFETLLSDSETLHAKARAADVNTIDATHRPLVPRALNLRRPDPAPVPAGGCFLENGAVGFVRAGPSTM
jgi:acetyl esterase/lipase